MVFYRKYRPQTIEELDSKEVRDKLRSVLKGPSVAHAFLFTGPKGLGKTSTARIVAKSLNCLNKKEGQIEPCNKCGQCLSINNGTNMDVLEIDGASNRGIDEIRDLREKIKLSPMAARKKIYIIDEVHMLTTEAFNALLKTLEEPPSHVVFMLCTTESHKLPGTILSRCLRIQFKKATDEELVRSFERIAKREKIDIEKDALLLIASLSDGSFRDGVKILEEVALISSDKKITKTSVEKNYSIASIQYKVAQLEKLLEEKDTKSALELVSKLSNDGVEIGFFIQELIEVLHSTLLYKAGVQSLKNTSMTIENTKLGILELKTLIELLAKAKNELKYAVLPQIPLELAIVGWGSLKQGSAHPLRDSLEPSGGNTSIASGDKSRLPAKEFQKIASKEPVKSSLQEEPRPSINISQQDLSKYNEHDALWTALIDKVKSYNHSVAGVLRGCSIKSFEGEKLILETNFKFHKERLSDFKTKDLLQKSFKEVLRKDVKIEIVLKGPA